MCNNKPPFMGERVRLGDLLTKARSKRCGDSSYPVLSMTMHDGIVRQDDRFKKSIASRDTKSYKVVMPGQLVVGFPIDEGVIYIQKLQQPGIMSPAYQVWDVDESRVRPRYLELALHSPRSMAYYAAKMRGTTARRRSITADNLCALEIPVPSLERQDCIVAAFKRVGSLLASCEQASERLDSLVKSQFVEMFGDPTRQNRFEVARLGEVYQVKSSKRIYAREQTSSGIPFYRLADIGSLIDGMIPSPELYISESRYLQLKAEGYVPLADDILVTARGTLGRCYIVTGEDRFYFQDGMITWLSKTKKSPLPAWLVELFSNAQFLERLNSSCSGTTVRYLSISDLANTQIPLPPLPLQQQFSSFVEEVDKSRFVARKSAELIMNMQALDIRLNARLQ